MLANMDVTRKNSLSGRTVLFVVNDPAFFLSHRLVLGQAARDDGARVVVVAPEEHAMEEIRNIGFETRSLSLSRFDASPFQEIRTLLALVRLYKELRPDLVHHVSIKPILYGTIAARVCNVKAVVNAIPGPGMVFCTKGVMASIRRVYASVLYKLALHHNNQRAIFQSQGDLDDFVRRGFVSEKESLIIKGAGVDLSIFRPSGKSAGSKVPIVLFAGRMIKGKGVLEFLKAAHALRSQNIQAQFWLAGQMVPGRPGSISSEELGRWLIPGYVEYLGKVEQMSDLFQKIDIFALPSSYEGIPKVLIEAAAMGKPSVVSDLPGCREVVKHGETGFIIPCGDIIQLTGYLRKLVEDRDLRARMGVAARKRVESGGFGVEDVCQATINLYHQLLEGVCAESVE